MRSDVDEERSQILERERALHRREREWSSETIDRLTRERDDSRAHAAGLSRRLNQIQTGRWWKLRGALLRLARVVGVRRPVARIKEAPPSKDLDASPRGADASSGTQRPTETSLAFWPEVRGNPFQQLLYGRVGEAGLRPLPLRELNDLSPRAPAGSILHLHWTSPVLHTAKSERDARQRLWRFMATLDDLRDGGWKLLWTVHNVLPHDCRFPELEAQLCQEIADRSDAVHVMCRATVDAVATRYVLPASRVRVIPHPSLDGAYPNDITQAQARRDLGLSDDDIVVGAFGAIRPYKRLDALLDAFEDVFREEPAIRLVVAGAPARAAGVEGLIERCSRHPAVVTRFERIPDDEIQRYVGACDALALAQSDPLNSGIAMLAFTFGRPVIAPRKGCIDDLVSKDTGITFDADVPGDLVRALKEAPRLRDERHRRAARARAEAVLPDEIAKRFASLASELASLGR